MNYGKMMLLSIFSASSLFFGIGCGEKVPIREMSLAKMGITRAESVKADQYAPDEIKMARSGLMESHNEVIKDEPEAAGKLAVKAREKAEEAYNKSVPLLARDSISSAEQSYEEATEAFAESLARDEYLMAQNGLKQSNDLFQDKKFYDAHLKAAAADSDAKKARDIAMGKKGILADGITDVNVTIDSARKYNAETHAAENLRLAEDNVKLAGDSLGSGKLKQGFSAMEVAKINADEALVRSMRGTSVDGIEEAKTLLGEAEKSPGAAVAKTDLAMARESLKSSEQLHGDSKYRESILASQDSLRLSRLVMGAKVSGKIDVSMTGKGNADTDKSQSDLDRERGYSIYVVQEYQPRRRDCLWGIAQKFYNNPRKWPVIHDANRDIIRNPNIIQPGWRLKIPIDSIRRKADCDNKDATTPHEPKVFDEDDGSGARVDEPEY